MRIPVSPNRDGEMLPSISAELPAYLVPPSSREAGTNDASSQTGAEQGPDRVELSVDRAIDAQSKAPDRGLYGADGRFVASSSGAGEHGDTRSSRQNSEDRRNLTLEEIDAVVPPAAREELRALADRVERQKSAKDLTSSDYRRISELMERVGRHAEARDALDRAMELEQSSTPSAAQERASLERAEDAADAADSLNASGLEDSAPARSSFEGLTGG